jgi:hypothetical protein
MITIFATPKNFEDIFIHIQENAIKSWRSISDDIQIVILGDSKGSKEIAEEVNADYIPKVRCSPKGTPYASDLFIQAEKIAKFPIITFINADIILPKNFVEEIKWVTDTMKKFLIIGHRWDMDIHEKINFQSELITRKFWETIPEKGELHAPSGIDYFVFNKGLWKTLPDFIIGRPGFDNWLIWKARRRRIPVIDATDSIQVVHQNHHFNFHNLKKDPKIHTEEEGQYNSQIHQGKILNIMDADYTLNKGNVEKKTDRAFKIRNLHRLPGIYPEIAILIKLYRRIYKLLIKTK